MTFIDKGFFCSIFVLNKNCTKYKILIIKLKSRQMKNLILILVCALTFMVSSTIAQTITVSSGGDVIASGVDVSGDTTVCNGSNITFTVALDVGIDHIQWVAVPGGTFAPNAISTTVTVTPTVDAAYIVHVYGPLPTDYVGWVQVNVVVADIPSSQTVTANGIVDTDGEYCTGEAGVVFGLTGSEIGAGYQMQIDGTSTDVGAAVNGTGTAITFDPAAAGNNYQILVRNLSGCEFIIR